jgi:peptide chain release factor subunit 1
MNMNVCDESIKELSLVYDEESMDTFVSLYFDGKDTQFMEHREKAVETVLKHDELKDFAKTMKLIKTYLERTDVGNVAIFASHRHDYFKVIPLPVKIENAFIVDASPYIRPLSRLADTWREFTLVLLNSNHAKIFSTSCGELREREELSAEIMNNHKKGGWSQARFQRLRKGSIHAFLTEVAEELQKITDKNIILAGPGQVKKELQALLPKQLQETVMGIIDVGIDDEQELFKESFALMADKGEEERSGLLEHIRKEILTDGLAIHGVEAALEAARNGQVEVLLVEGGYRLRGWICEQCQAVGKGESLSCPYCGKRTSEVDVVEEIIEFAERTDALVEFTDDEDIRTLGHVVALLRYK